MDTERLAELRERRADQISRDMLDYPTAWDIQKSGVLGEHDENCSANPEHPSGMGGDHFLCDCNALLEVWLELGGSDRRIP